MQIFPVFGVALGEFQRLHHARLVDVVARAARLPLNAVAHQAKFHAPCQHIVVFNRVHNGGVLRAQHGKLNFRRVRIPL